MVMCTVAQSGRISDQLHNARLALGSDRLFVDVGVVAVKTPLRFIGPKSIRQRAEVEVQVNSRQRKIRVLEKASATLAGLSRTRGASTAATRCASRVRRASMPIQVCAPIDKMNELPYSGVRRTSRRRRMIGEVCSARARR